MNTTAYTLSTCRNVSNFIDSSARSRNFNLAEILISRLDTHLDFRGKLYTLETAFKEIRKGNSAVGRDYGSESVHSDNYKSLTLKEATEKARYYKSVDKDAYHIFKQSMPAYSFGCTLDGRSPGDPTSVLGIDLDDINDIRKAKMFATASPYTLACFTTLGGNGLRILVKVYPTPTPETHRYAWFAVRNRYKFIAKVDPAGKEMNKLSALAYDPEIYVNENSYPINWQINREAFLAEFPHDEIEQRALSGLPDEYRAAIEELTYKESGWSRERIPCLFKYKDGGTHEFDAWNSRSNAMEVRKIEGGYEVRCHKCDGRTEQFVANPQSKRYVTPKLSYEPSYEPVGSDLPSLRNLLKSEVLDWNTRTRNTRRKHLLILGTGAGTGKSTAALVNLDKYADISPTRELADEKFYTARSEGKNAYRHRSRQYNKQAAAGLSPENVRIGLHASRGEVPCAYPDICDNLAAKGYMPTKVFCPTCPRIGECESYGYRSQRYHIQNHSAIFFSFQDDFFSDPKNKWRIEAMQKDADFVLVLDEVDPANLTPKRGFTFEYLRQLCQDFEGTRTGGFLSKVYNAFTCSDWIAEVKPVLDEYDRYADTIDKNLEKIPVRVQFFGLDTTTADLERLHADGLIDIHTLNDLRIFLENMPENTDLRGEPIFNVIVRTTYRGKSKVCVVVDAERLSSAKYLLGYNEGVLPDSIIPKADFEQGKTYHRFIFLKTFCDMGFGNIEEPFSLPSPLLDFTKDLREFIRVSVSDTPACHEGYNDKDGITYYLPPDMNARRGIFISAGGIEQIIQELYKYRAVDIEAVISEPPMWREICELWQISTGRYTPAQSLLVKEDNKVVDVKERGIDFINIILNEADTGKKILVVSPKDFTTEGVLKDNPHIAKLNAHPNITVINHYHAEGMNGYQDRDISFVFHYEPRPDEIQNIAKRVYRDATLDFTREETTIIRGGLVLENVQRYTDPLVQGVYDKECEKRLMQAITRLRQMINPNKKCYLFTSEPVSNIPVQPKLFTLAQIEGCQAKYGTLENLADYIKEHENLSVNELVDVENVSVSTAYRRTEKQRQRTKTDLESTVLILKGQGLSVRKIASELGISRGKVEGAMKKARLS